MMMMMKTAFEGGPKMRIRCFTFIMTPVVSGFSLSMN